MSNESFDRYIVAWDADDYTDFSSCFGCLCNPLAGWDIEKPLPCDLVMGGPGKRPEAFVHLDTGHELGQAQGNGISFDRLLDLYAAAGNDIRPHLEVH